MNSGPVIDEIRDISCPLLHDIYHRGVVKEEDGTERRLHGHIHPQYAAAIYRAVLIAKPKVLLENRYLRKREEFDTPWNFYAKF